ncbi:MAG: CBS domain-containing protein [Planctomycetota bacterium]|nr:CBS domain-containing protein [Planctomycetota bacterium]
MATAEKILAEKGGDVVWIGPEATVLEAVRLMNIKRVGAVIILAEGRLAGIFTERDVMRRIVGEQLEATKTRVGDVMTTPVACAAMHTTDHELREVFRNKRIRHLPVVDAGRVVGVVSIGDVNRVEKKVQDQTINYLQQYMSVT